MTEYAFHSFCIQQYEERQFIEETEDQKPLVVIFTHPSLECFIHLIIFLNFDSHFNTIKAGVNSLIKKDYNRNYESTIYMPSFFL